MNSWLSFSYFHPFKRASYGFFQDQKFKKIVKQFFILKVYSCSKTIYSIVLTSNYEGKLSDETAKKKQYFYL